MPKKSGLVTQREKEVSRRVKRFREWINWPQPAFATELQISRDRLASIEYARTPLRYDVGYRLCFLFDVNHEWLATGNGEMRATTTAAELPVPEGQHRRSLFSEVWDRVRKPMAGPAGKKVAAARAERGNLIPHFDPQHHVQKFMADLFAKEKFPPLEKQEFALEVTTFARELAMRMRRNELKGRSLAAQGREVPGPHARMATKLQSAIERLEKEVAKIAADMNKLNPVSVDPNSLPADVAQELKRCQDSIDKITEQIQEAEGKIRALASRRAV